MTLELNEVAAQVKAMGQSLADQGPKRDEAGHAARELLKQFSQPEVEYTISEFDYIFKSIYLFQIYRWIEIFPSSNILILNSDRFFENTASVMKDVWHFLQLDCYSSSTYIKYNVGNYIPVADEIKQELGRLFEPYNRKLEEYLNLKFNW